MSWVFRRPTDYRVKPSRLFALLFAASATSGAASVVFANSGTLTGSGALSGTCSISSSASAEHGSVGVLSGACDNTFAATGAILGSGELAGSSAIVFSTSAVATGTAALNPVLYKRAVVRWSRPAFDYYAYANRLVIFPLSVPSGISGQCDISFGSTTGVLTGIASIAGTLPITLSSTASLVGTGTLAGSLPAVFTVEGDLSGVASGSVSGSIATIFTPAATLSGEGSLFGTVTNTLTAEMTPGSIQQISGAASIVFDLSGALTPGIDIPSATRRKRGIRLSRSNRGIKDT